MSILGQKREATGGNSSGGILAKSRQKKMESAFNRLNSKEEFDYNTQREKEIQNHFDRADRMMSLEDSAKLRSQVEAEKIKEQTKKTAADKMDRDPIVRSIGKVSELGQRAANRVGDFLGLGRGLDKSNPERREEMPEFLRTATDRIYKPAETGAEKAADITGEILSYAQPTKVAYKLAGRLGMNGIKNQALRRLTTGFVAEGGVQGAKEIAEASTGLNDQSFGERLTEVGLAGGLAGGLNVAAPYVGKLAGGILQRAKGKASAIPDAASNVPVKGVQATREGIENVSAKADNNESWFTRLFGTQGVGITPGAKNGKEMIDTHIVNRSKKLGPLPERISSKASEARQNLVDRFSPFELVSKETYDTAMDSSRANNLANITIKDKFVDLEGNVIGNSLKDVYSIVPRGMKNIADRYIIMRDAVSRMDRGLKVYGDEPWFPKNADEAAAKVADLEQRNPWLKNYGDEWNKFNQNRQDLWVSSGIASKELIDNLRYTNPNYAPMFRQQDAVGLRGKLALNTSKSGFSGQKAPIKRAVGSIKKIIDPAQGMIETTASSYHAMMRNRAMQELYKAVLKNPERYKGVIEIVDESADMKASTLKAINEAIADNGPDGIADLLNNEVDNLFKKAKQAGKSGDQTVTVMVAGEPVKMNVMDPSLLTAIDGITPNQLEGIMRVSDSISRGIKQSATGLFAPLQGARLAFRDLPTAFAQSRDKVRFLGDIAHATISHIGEWLPNFIPGTEQLGKLVREYYRAGGGYEAYLKGDSRIRAASRDITRDPLLSGRNLLKQAKRLNPLRPFKGLGDAMENIPRIAAYAAEMRKSGWNRNPENVRNAINAGREATVNWSRRGAKMQGIEAFAPYSNAAIQGTYRFIKRFKEQPISATALILATAAAKIAAYEKFKDDPDYQQRSKLEKGIPVSKTKDGKFITVPVEPTESYLADQILNFYKWSKDGEKMPSSGENIQGGLEAFAPSLISGPASVLTTGNVRESISKTAGGTVLDPIIAGATGKNYFGGDIIPREYQNDPTSLQYNETTSAAGKWAAENLGIDAFTFDYLANKFGGDIAKVGLPLTSEVGRVDVEGNIIDQVNARLKLLEDPVMRNNIADDYYKYLKVVYDAKAISDRKGTPLPNWYQSAYDEVTSMKKNSVNNIVSDLNAKKKAIARDTALSAKDRADQLRDVQREINIIRIQGIKRLQELGVKR